jgi:hypothetical protein
MMGLGPHGCGPPERAGGRGAGRPPASHRDRERSAPGPAPAPRSGHHTESGDVARPFDADQATGQSHPREAPQRGGRQDGG